MTAPQTIAQALALASQHWSNRAGGKVMDTMANRAGVALGLTKNLQSITAGDGVALLAKLRGEGLSPKTVESYYQALRRALTLSGVSTALWPSAPSPPRKTRDALQAGDLDKLIAWFQTHKPARSKAADYMATADLAILLRATGMRVNIEALAVDRLTVTLGGPYDTLHVRGKGDHERVIPVVDTMGRALLRDESRLKGLRSITYNAHLKRWRKAVAALGISSRLPTPHAVRHSYATDALDKSGGNLVMVQELLGHADTSTTARYLHNDITATAKALSGAVRPASSAKGAD